MLMTGGEGSWSGRLAISHLLNHMNGTCIQSTINSVIFNLDLHNAIYAATFMQLHPQFPDSPP